ncbi:hypothetical protein IFM89_028790 [Coptis chinensis]|uniref:MORF/ORRM1/DAG-like MORF domain-containing protein n=1 Tax=Coptis chinensis TaxID=261450 RepID=A0A835LCW1_9MAGN|nr:hypothetical protein IFM89_028790 [Coptis chinensis]
MFLHIFFSKEEARNKIYLVSCERPFGFGAQIDANSANGLKGIGHVDFLVEDHYYGARNEDPNERMQKNKVYAVWWKIPFGFCAAIDEDSVNKLKALQDVLVVLLDYSLDIKRNCKFGEGDPCWKSIAAKPQSFI